MISNESSGLMYCCGIGLTAIMLIFCSAPSKCTIVKDMWSRRTLIVTGGTNVSHPCPNHVLKTVYCGTLCLGTLDCSGFEVQSNPNMCTVISAGTGVLHLKQPSNIYVMSGYVHKLLINAGYYQEGNEYIAGIKRGVNAELADAVCREIVPNGYPLMIKTKEDEEFMLRALNNNFATLEGKEFLIGMNDSVAEGDFKWYDGDDVAEDASGLPILPFLYNENDNKADEDFVLLKWEFKNGQNQYEVKYKKASDGIGYVLCRVKWPQ